MHCKKFTKYEYFLDSLSFLWQKESHLPLFVEAQRIKLSQQWWRGTDLLKYLHLCFLCLSCPPAPRRASMFFHSQASVFEFVFLWLDKCRPLRQTSPLHLVAPEGVWHKTNRSGGTIPPRSTWLISYAIAVMLCHGICSVTSGLGPTRAHGISSLTTKQHWDSGAEVDKFINDNNEDDEDDDNINN